MSRHTIAGGASSWSNSNIIAAYHESVGYDASGNRITKTVAGHEQAEASTFYVRDAQGNTMGVYDLSGGYTWQEQHLYGSSRLGMAKVGLTIADGTPLSTDAYTAVGDPLLNSNLGKRIYELSNHLGNVMATISDKRIGFMDGHYEAELLSANDYYPFGMGMPGRSYGGGNGYRYGFNGQEKSTEIDANGSNMTAEFWQYDGRIGRRWNVDPVIKEYESPYAAFRNTPGLYSDIKGNDSKDWIKQKGADGKTHYKWDASVSGAGNTPAGWEYVGKTGGYQANEYQYVSLYDKGRWSQRGDISFASGNAGSSPGDEEVRVPTKDATPSFAANNQATISAPNSLSGYSDFDRGMVTSPATQAAALTLCPECAVAFGGAQVYSGVRNGNYIEAGLGGLTLFGGALGTIGKWTPPMSYPGPVVGGSRSLNPLGGTKNCAGCTIAGDATLKGAPASALDHGVTSTINVAAEFGASWNYGQTVLSVSKTMEGLGNGATGVIFGNRGTGQVGHFFNVVNKNGAIQFLDFQKSGTAVMPVGDAAAFKELWFINTTR